MVKVIGVVKTGNKIEHYVCTDSTGKEISCSKEQLASVIRQGECSNATAQMYQGKLIIRVKGNTKTITNKQDSNKREEKRQKIPIVISGKKAVEVISKMEDGDAIKLEYQGKFYQAIYTGMRAVQGRQARIFYTSVVTSSGEIALTDGFIESNLNVRFKVGCDNTELVKTLRNEIRQLRAKQVVKLMGGEQKKPDWRIGKQVVIQKMRGEPQYTGKTGTVRRIDDKGQIWGTWGGCALIPGEDEFTIEK